ncbi:hypothetical protein GGE35_004260 [Rhizobium cellulosilyticum]|uniref:Uncharacterized protein n=1 Tax=Aliirhizobium cellulosilyticum TaxID=393664 RepID=A0A7W6XD84_9HYPH|nr:hypothetical protein [Rhizobium cellulosilyticum]MBB4413799.1 hypothetical protein [Rhizobium cellulosilyticum]MBB4448414.1 hypothetical protein [Rhizobium cellulosilyticum]
MLLEGFAAGNIASFAIDKIRVPVEIGCAGNMASLIGSRVDADFEYPYLWIVEVLLNPLGIDQSIRCISCR